MQELIDLSEEMSRKIGFPAEQCALIILARQQNALLQQQLKLLEKISDKMELESYDITRIIN